MYYAIALILPILGFVLSKKALAFYIKRSQSSQVAERETKIKEVEVATEELKAIAAYSDAYASKGQLETLRGQLRDARAAISTQKEQLKQVEEALAAAQKRVEEKEVGQQDLKSLREGDERKLTETLSAFEALSSESVILEQQLAESIKNMEEMLAGVDLTDDQRAILNELNDALLMAGGRLRDLLTEYEVVKERLQGLQQQFKDLEEEYTRLVEQQLGT